MKNTDTIYRTATISVEPLSGSANSEIISVVTKALRTNPLHLAIFKSLDRASYRKQERLFSKVLTQSNCNLVVARCDEKIVGVLNYYRRGQCQLGTIDTLKMLPGLLLDLGNRLPPVLKWKSAWASHDPGKPHLHLGPLAVLPGWQQQGIGSSLLSWFCRMADQQCIDAYLETDKEENVKFYEKFGFREIEQDTVQGVKNWFMWRAVKAR